MQSLREFRQMLGMHFFFAHRHCFVVMHKTFFRGAKRTQKKREWNSNASECDVQMHCAGGKMIYCNEHEEHGTAQLALHFRAALSAE